MKKFYLLLVLGVVSSAMAQSPVKATFAYSRSTIPGAPTNTADGAQNSFPTTYLIYVVVTKGRAISAISACVQKKGYAATLKKVDSPVVVEHDPNVRSEEKDVLVAKTPDDVYQVELREGKGPEGNDCAKDRAAQDNPVIVYLKSGRSLCYAATKKLVALPPVAAM